ncbi:MAG: DUF5134 domain-containing protein [Propioniciclava sp.]|uniref:DUF5134 domain-containing protein n=1 Tax=Propioniciclava sp. TaxID=2038686 RepID=UPI0039E48857
MFSFDATPVKFIGLLVLFVWCTGWSVYELTRPQGVRQRVSNGLHLGMAVVMLLMVARPTWTTLTSVVPTGVWAGVFALATGWFAWLTVDAFRACDKHGRLHFAGHATMFAAMTWHLAAMASMAAGMSGAMNSASHHDMGSHAHSAATMADWMTAQAQPGGVLWWFALIGIPLMTYLLAASFVAAKRALAPDPARTVVRVGGPSRDHQCHEERAQTSATARLAAASDFAMNFGMFWMSTGLLVPILPFFALLAF